ncbi:Protein CBG17237 [Caenorhabditis briggsae]|uniref:Protein CBG17237 n=1 Tax=Caenorhabditis briggsae TaxID=6238 RepID=A8XQI1_CAEBR|nr:Protein CBG17237 [Caenorhabditis briggsae]CAP34906.2 Protein CBG17237 [Caenorhabditis briggsae]
MQIFLKEELDALRAQKETKASTSSNNQGIGSNMAATPTAPTTPTINTTQAGNKIEVIIMKSKHHHHSHKRKHRSSGSRDSRESPRPNHKKRRHEKRRHEDDDRRDEHYGDSRPKSSSRDKDRRDQRRHRDDYLEDYHCGKRRHNGESRGKSPKNIRSDSRDEPKHRSSGSRDSRESPRPNHKKRRHEKRRHEDDDRRDEHYGDSRPKSSSRDKDRRDQRRHRDDYLEDYHCRKRRDNGESRGKSPKNIRSDSRDEPKASDSLTINHHGDAGYRDEPTSQRQERISRDDHREDARRDESYREDETRMISPVRQKAENHGFGNETHRDQSPTIKSEVGTPDHSHSDDQRNTPMSQRDATSPTTEIDQAEEENTEPPPKKIRQERKSKNLGTTELTANVLRVSEVSEKEQFRMALQESEDSPLILAICNYECYESCESVKFGDRVQIEAEVMKKNDSNVVTKIWIDRILRIDKGVSRQNSVPHSIASLPFCIKPRFIHELSDVEIKKTVLQVTILNVKFTVYKGCLNCQHAMRKVTKVAFCPKCKRRRCRDMPFGRMRVMDFSGQIYVSLRPEVMEKFLDILGYTDHISGYTDWDAFTWPSERANYVFISFMMEIEKKSNEWECTDVAEMDWAVYAKYLKEKEEKENRQTEEPVQ